MVTTSYKALLLINPASRSGAEVQLDEGIEQLAQAGIDVVQVFSESATHACDEIRRYHKHVEFVIIGGGDGTVSSASKCLYDLDLPFALLPLGTANDLARSLGIPVDLSKAFQVIVDNKRRRIDLGWVNGHYFFNVANIGLGVHITHELTPEVKKTWGVLSYLKALFAALDQTKSFVLKLDLDGKTFQWRSIHVGVGNGRYYGGGNIIDECCTIDDGLLSLYSLRPQGFWDLLSLAPLLRGGRQYQAKRIFTARAKQIEVRTSPSQEVHADGEPVTQTPAVFKVIPNALQVIAPPVPVSPAAEEVST